MAGETGLTLYEPADIRFNVGIEEEDEEALEEQRRREKLLEAQLHNAFDDSSDDDSPTQYNGTNKKTCNSPNCSTGDDDDEGNYVHKSIDEGRSQNNSSGSIIFSRVGRKLSNISERSVNNSSEVSHGFGDDHSPSTSYSTDNIVNSKELVKNEHEEVFIRGSRSKIKEKFGLSNHLKTQNMNSPAKLGNSYRKPDKKDIGNIMKQRIQSNSPNSKRIDKFVPLLVKAPIQQGGSGDACRFTGVNNTGENEQQNPAFRNYTQNQQYQPFVNNSPLTERSTAESQAAYRNAELNSERQLEVLYEVRMKEIQRLTAQLETERKEAATYKQQALLQIALLQSDMERAMLSRTEADKLLVASKQEITNLLNEVDDLKQALEKVTKDKKQSDEMLEMSRVQIQELENSMTLMERCDANMRQTKQMNQMIKDLKSNHEEELSLLQKQLETVTKKLREKEEETRRLEQRLDQLAVDKASIIRQLSRSLEDTQHQCQELLESNVMAENVKLHHQLDQALLERDELNEKVNRLKEECRSMKSTLDTISPTDSMVQMGIASRTGSSNSATNFKAELHRALLNLKSKRAEVERQNEILSVKDKEITEFKTKQEISYAQNEALKDELNNVNEELLSIKNIYKEMKENQKRDDTESTDSKKQQQHIQKDKAVQCDIEKKIEADLKLKEISVRLEQSQREGKELKELYLAVTTELTLVKDRLYQITEERDSLNGQLDLLLDQTNQVQQDRKELLSEIEHLKDQLAADNQSVNEKEQQLMEECVSLRQELTAMSTRHEEELCIARSELQAYRDRITLLEKTTRHQFETTIKNLNQEREMLKTKCDEKEVQIKKLIESRKRVPSMVSVGTETEEQVDWEKRLEAERLRCQQEYDAALAQMEQRHIQDKENIRHTHISVIEQLENQLILIEERTKEKTVNFFSEKIRELETKYQNELNVISKNSESDRLRNEIACQARQIEILSECLERESEPVRQRLKEVEVEREEEKERAGLLLQQWAQEMKNLQEELMSKEKSIQQLKVKLASATQCAKTNHDKLLKTNKEITESINRRMNEFKTKVKSKIEKYEKDVWEKVLKIETVYRRRDMKLRQELKKQLMA